MSDEILFEELNLQLPPLAESEESGVEDDPGMLILDDALDEIDTDDGFSIDIGRDVFSPDESVSWLDAGEESPDLEVGGVAEESGDGWLDDRPMALDLGFEPENEGADSADRGEEGLDEPLVPSDSGDVDSVDLPPLESPTTPDDREGLDESAEPNPPFGRGVSASER